MHCWQTKVTCYTVNLQGSFQLLSDKGSIGLRINKSISQDIRWGLTLLDTHTGMIKLWSWPDCCPSMEQMLVHFTVASSSLHCEFSAFTAFVQFTAASGVALSDLSVFSGTLLLLSCKQVGCFCLHLAHFSTLSHLFSFAIWPWIRQRRQSPFLIMNWVLSLVGFLTNSWHISNSWDAFPHQ